MKFVTNWKLLFWAYLYGVFQLGLLTVLAAPAMAAPPLELRFTQLSGRQGLQAVTVTALLQDTQGFIWLGSERGLSRYDGYKLTTYHHDDKDPYSISNNTVTALFQDRLGRMWVVTKSSLELYEPATGRFITYRSNVNSLDGEESISSIEDDGHQGLWLGTPSGLRNFDPATRRERRYQHDATNPATLAHQQVLALKVDGKGDLWIGLPTGVDRLVKGGDRFEHFQVEAQTREPKRNQVRALLLSNDQKLWIGTRSGLAIWDIRGKLPESEEIDNLFPTLAVVKMLQDHDGNIWIATEFGLYRRDAQTGQFTNYQHHPAIPQSLANQYTYALLQDRSCVLWVGTFFNGASRVDLCSKGIESYSAKPYEPNGLSNGGVTGITGADNGRLWITTAGGGLNLFNPATGTSTVFRHSNADKNSLHGDDTTAVALDNRGHLWVSTRQGISEYIPGTHKFYRHLFSSDYLSNYVTSIVPSRDGLLFVGTLKGLHEFDPVTRRSHTYLAGPNGLDSSHVNITLEDEQGRLWIGTSVGLDMLDRRSGKFVHFRHDPANPNSLAKGRVVALYKDAEDSLWIAGDAGLQHLAIKGSGTAKFQAYGSAHGLNEIFVGTLLPGPDRTLWMSTAAGISCFDIKTERFKNFTRSDGVADTEHFSRAAYRSPDGVLYFGGLHDGMTAVQPTLVQHNRRPPQVVLTDLQVFGRSIQRESPPSGVEVDSSIETASRIVLSYQNSMFSLEFAGLHFAAPESNQYAYQLEGFDRDWIYTGASKRYATYTNLDPGHYKFKVKAANKDGIWSDEHSVTIVITPPYWKTWWFRLTLLLLLLLAAYGWHRSRVRNLLFQRRVLEGQVQDRTREIAETLLELKKTQQQLVFREKMTSVGTLTAGMAHEINNPANFAHVGAQTMEMELERFRAFLLQIAGDDADEAILNDIQRHFAVLFEQVGTITEGTSRIRSLVKDLRTFSRLDEADQKAVEIAANLQSTIRLVRTQYAGSIDITLNVEANPMLECRPAQLNQVFMNLILNACHAIEAKYPPGQQPPAGKLNIRTRIVDKELWIEFEDNGCGIPADVIDHIFEPFFTTKQVGEGTGLGLSISFGIIEKHGGRITVSSTLNIGTVFTVQLPLPASAA
jgi:signal transduction histidine kinase/ligand-binding sensor domain-containing protein